MAQFVLADVPGQFQRGTQFALGNQAMAESLAQSKFAGIQQQKLGPLQVQQAEANLQGSQFTNKKNKETDAFERNVFSAMELQSVPDDQKTNFLINKIQKGEIEKRDMTQSKQALELISKPNGLEELAAGTEQLLSVAAQRGIINPTKSPQGFTLGAGQQRFDAQGNLIASGVEAKTDKPKDFTLSAGQQRFTSEGKVVASGSDQITIPGVLLKGIDPLIAEKGAAAFSSAGGGKDGLTAFQKIIDQGTEQQRRLASPAILKANFPQASRAEQAQLQGVMDAAKTTESGLKAAGKVRVEQKRLVKAAAFQERAIELLTGILSNDELGDVLGSIEGSFDFRLQDSEAELIADIEEAGNILTADNLSLMSGVLSESDIKILKNLAGGGLIRTRTEERFIKDVTALRDKLASQKVVTIDERDAAQDPAEGSTATGPNGEKAVFTNGQWVIQNAG